MREAGEEETDGERDEDDEVRGGETHCSATSREEKRDEIHTTQLTAFLSDSMTKRRPSLRLLILPSLEATPRVHHRPPLVLAP